MPVEHRRFWWDFDVLLPLGRVGVQVRDRVEEVLLGKGIWARSETDRKGRRRLNNGLSVERLGGSGSAAAEKGLGVFVGRI